MGVFSDGTLYEVPDGIFFSFPVICKDGKYEIVRDLKLSEIAKEKIKRCVDDLLEERSEIDDAGEVYESWEY